MRLFSLLALSSLLAWGSAFAQDGQPQQLTPEEITELKAKHVEKTQEDWFTSLGWTDDYDEARARAAESGKVIFAYFTRSYAL